MNQPWICPKCNAVMSPYTPTCFYCKPNVCDHEFEAYPKTFPSSPYGYTPVCRKCGYEPKCTDFTITN